MRWLGAQAAVSLIGDGHVEVVASTRCKRAVRTYPAPDLASPRLQAAHPSVAGRRPRRPATARSSRRANRASHGRSLQRAIVYLWLVALAGHEVAGPQEPQFPTTASFDDWVGAEAAAAELFDEFWGPVLLGASCRGSTSMGLINVTWSPLSRPARSLSDPFSPVLRNTALVCGVTP